MTLMRSPYYQRIPTSRSGVWLFVRADPELVHPRHQPVCFNRCVTPVIPAVDSSAEHARQILYGNPLDSSSAHTGRSAVNCDLRASLQERFRDPLLVIEQRSDVVVRGERIGHNCSQGDNGVGVGRMAHDRRGHSGAGRLPLGHLKLRIEAVDALVQSSVGTTVGPRGLP